MGAVAAPPQGKAEMPEDIDSVKSSPSVVVAQIGLGVHDLRMVGP